MFNYIKADLYRLFHKTSNRIYWMVLALAFVLIMVLNNSNFNGDPTEITNFYFLTAGMSLITVGSFVICPQVYSTVYLDDYSSRNSIRVFSSGLRKSEYLVAKIIVTVIYMLAAMTFMALAFLAGYGLLFLLNKGIPFFTSQQIIYLLSQVGFYILFTIAFATVTQIVAIKTQSSTIPLTLFILLSLGMGGSIINMIMKLPILRSFDIDPYLLSTNTGKIQTVLMNMSGMTDESGSIGGISVQLNLADQIQSLGMRPFVIIGAYIVLAILVSWVLLKRTDIKEN